MLTLFIAPPPNGSSVWVRIVGEVSGAVSHQETTAFGAPLNHWRDAPQCSMLRTEECGSVGPMGLSVTISRFRHFCTVVGLIE